jgi:hypothetical protein
MLLFPVIWLESLCSTQIGIIGRQREASSAGIPGPWVSKAYRIGWQTRKLADLEREGPIAPVIRNQRFTTADIQVGGFNHQWPQHLAAIVILIF